MIDDAAFAVPLLLLVVDERLFNPAFLSAVAAGGWSGAERDLGITTALGVVVVAGWSAIEAFVRARRASRAA